MDVLAFILIVAAVLFALVEAAWGYVVVNGARRVPWHLGWLAVAAMAGALLLWFGLGAGPLRK